MYPLELNAKLGAWRIFAARKADPAFLAFQDKVFRRDSYTCQFCGFQAKEYQEVVNLDQNYNNSKMSNLATACCFCAQCFFLDAVGVGNFGGGTLIYLPEISQNNLNSFCHVLFCAINNETEYKPTAQAIYRNLRLRSQPIEEHFGEEMSEPALFGQMLIEAQISKENLRETLRDVRLLAKRAAFKEMISTWSETAFKELEE